MTALDWDPSPRKLRQFAVAGVLVLGLIAGLAYARGSGSLGQGVLLTFVALLAAFGTLRPTALRLPYVLLSVITLPIGIVVSHLVLGILFYGVITPLGLLQRLARPDPLETQLDRGSITHWKERHRPHDKASYLRQA